MREVFTEKLLACAKSNPNTILMTGDHGYALFDEFRSRLPKQYINAGVAEQNMVGMAAGFAKVGLRPIVYALAAFVPIRTLEQIKIDIAHDNLPVVFIGDGAGFVYSHLGTSHQCLEDISCLRAIPNMTILSPSDPKEMSECMDYALSCNGPTYIRIGKADLECVHTKRPQSLLSSGLIQTNIGDAKKPVIIATGSLVSTAQRLGKHLNLSVWSAPLLKPFNSEHFLKYVKFDNGIITLEEHSVMGGLGSIICEITSQHKPCKVLRLGVHDRFTEKCGSYNYLLSEHHLDYESIFAQMQQYFAEIIFA